MTIYQQILTGFDIISLAKQICQITSTTGFGHHFIGRLMIAGAVWNLWVSDAIEGGRADPANKELIFGPSQDVKRTAGLVVHELYHALDPKIQKIGLGIYGWWERIYFAVNDWAAKYAEASTERWLIRYVAMAILQCRNYFSPPEIRAYFSQVRYLGWWTAEAKDVYRIYLHNGRAALGLWLGLPIEVAFYLKEKLVNSSIAKRIRSNAIHSWRQG